MWNGGAMEFSDALAALRARWWLPVLLLLVAAGAAVGVSLQQTPRYVSTTQLFVSPSGANQTADPLQGNQVAQDRVPSYAQLAAGPDLARRIVDRLGLPMTPQHLQKEMAVEAVPGTVLIKVTVTDPSPDRAYSIAQTVGAEFPVQVTQLETAGGTASPVRVTVAEPARMPDRPSSPQVLRNGVIAAVLGLLAGTVLALMRRVLDRTVRDLREAAELARAPVLGVVPRSRTLRSHRVPNGGTVGVAFQQLRAMVQCLNLGEPNMFAISSSLGSEGKTTVAVNLGLALADEGYAVTVVEADLSSPSLARELGMPEDMGLTHVLAGVADLGDAIRPHPRGAVSVLPAGTMPRDLPEPLQGGRLFPILEKLRADADVVLVDGPPLLASPDGARIAAHTAGVLLAVRYGKTRRDHVRQAVGMLEFAGARTLGVVLTMVPPRTARTMRFSTLDTRYNATGRHADPDGSYPSEDGRLPR